MREGERKSEKRSKNPCECKKHVQKSYMYSNRREKGGGAVLYVVLRRVHIINTGQETVTAISFMR